MVSHYAIEALIPDEASLITITLDTNSHQKDAIKATKPYSSMS